VKPRLIGLAVVALLVATVLAAASVGVQRYGPEQGVFGNLCGPDMDELCYKPLLNGGFPLGFVYDAPGISVEDKLAFEDRFRVLPFLADVAAYSALLAGSWMWGRQRRALRARGGRGRRPQR